jgi:multidrug efflux pump subunit AcrA (membrane-fusion protein)
MSASPAPAPFEQAIRAAGPQPAPRKTIRRVRWRVWLRVAIALLAVAGIAFGWRQLRRNRQIADLPTAAARKGDFLVIVRCRGELTARRSEQLTAPLDIPDLQIVWLAPPGGQVKAAEVVVRFDPSKAQQDLKEKSAALLQAQASLEQATAQARITADQDNVDLSTAKYNVEKAKLEASKQAIVSVLQGQESEIELHLAEEKLKVQETAVITHRKSGEAKIASLEHARDTAKRQVEIINAQIAQMNLKSPLNGVINYLPNYSQGWMNAQPFKVGDHAVPGGALAEIPDLSTLEMESKVDEVDRGRINVGDTVVVHVDAFPEKSVSGKLISITPLTEQSFNEWPPTRSFRAFARLDKPDSRMRPGMNAGADLVQTKIPEAISVPAKAVFTVNGKPAVYVKDRNQYTARPVSIKARNPDEVAIEGVAAGTLVALTEPPQEKR